MEHVPFRALPARYPALERACCIVDVTTGFSVESKLPRLHKTTPHHRHLLPLSFLASTEQLSTACVGPEVFCNCTTFLPPEATTRDNTGMTVSRLLPAPHCNAEALLVYWESGTYKTPGGIPPLRKASACSVISQQVVTLKSLESPLPCIYPSWTKGAYVNSPRTWLPVQLSQPPAAGSQHSSEDSTKEDGD